MDSISLLRAQLGDVHGLLEGTIDNVTAEQSSWTPPGVANPLAATYAHAVFSEDFIVNAVLRGAAPLAADAWSGRSGMSEPPPMPPDWAQWARETRFDLPALRQYAKAVAANTDEYLGSLKPEDLDRKIDMPMLGQRDASWLLNNVVLTHIASHCGEIACLKGIQGARGYPF